MKDYYRLSLKLFPEVTPFNKMHHLRHNPECLYYSGLTLSLCCLGYEAKHRMSKRYGCECCNFKNLSKTMMKLCEIAQFDSNLCLIILHLVENDVVFMTNCLEVYGTKYRIGLLVAMDNGVGTPKGDSVFVKIDEIIIFNSNRVYFWCKKSPVLSLERLLNVYCVEEG